MSTIFNPVILDCTDILKGENIQQFSEQFGDGLQKYGFLYLVNHGIKTERVNKLQERCKQFFELPFYIKKKYLKRDFCENYFGFLPTGLERAVESDNPQKSNSITTREAFDFWGSDVHDSTKYPNEIANTCELVCEIQDGLHLIIRSLLRSLAIYLDMDEDTFLSKHTFLQDRIIETASNLRTMYYFPIGKLTEKPLFRLLPHCDWGTMTFIFQDEIGGLESMLQDGSWIEVPYVKDSIIVQTGLATEMWTGGNLSAVTHRVRATTDNSRLGRQSLAYFLHPDGHDTCRPLLPVKSNYFPLFPDLSALTNIEFFRTRLKNSTAKY